MRRLVIPARDPTSSWVGMTDAMKKPLLLACSFFVMLTACAPLPQKVPRPAHSSLGCMRAAIKDRVPSALPDSQKHCIAAAMIAKYCSVTEATLASVGKELQDLLGPGDAEWRDLGSDRHGIDCARASASDEAVLACCLQTASSAKR
jgi:hypothetical protein